MKRRLAPVMVVVTLGLLCPTRVSADGVDVGQAPNLPTLVLTGEHGQSRQQSAGAITTRPKTPPVWEQFFQCPTDADTGTYGCRINRQVDGDELSEGDILRAVREIGLPRLEVRVQPGERTLVNVRTIFSTDPQQFRRSVELLGFDVDLVASPVSYTWNHGDGTSRSTNRPGRPYPSFDVTHRYRKAADVVRPSVDVTYRVRYRVDAGTWSTLSQTVTAPGPAAELEVREAVPVLTAP